MNLEQGFKAFYLKKNVLHEKLVFFSSLLMQLFSCKGYNDKIGEVVVRIKEGAKRNGRMDCIYFPCKTRDTILYLAGYT